MGDVDALGSGYTYLRAVFIPDRAPVLFLPEDSVWTGRSEEKYPSIRHPSIRVFDQIRDSEMPINLRPRPLNCSNKHVAVQPIAKRLAAWATWPIYTHIRAKIFQ